MRAYAVGAIYEIIQNATSAYYLGSSIKPQERWRTHLRDLNRGTHFNQKLQRAWDKHGQDAFRFQVIRLVPASRLLRIEDGYLKLLRPHFNIKFDANGGATRTGHHHTDSAKRKIAEAHVGMKASTLAKERMSRAAKRRGSTWTAWSSAARARFLQMARSQSGVPKSREHVLSLKKAHTKCRCPRHKQARLRRR